MATEQRIYRGDLIQSLLATCFGVTERDTLRKYVLNNGEGDFGVPCEMLESEADMRNRRLASANSDYRWLVAKARTK